MLTIRNYQETDAEALWAIHFNTIRTINIQDYSQKQVEAWAPNSFKKDWERCMNNLSPFIAQINGVIVGYTDLQANGLINHFFCHHKYQGIGIGRALMTHVLSVGKERDVKRYHSEVSITARPFYEHFGFNVFKKQEVELREQKFINFVMEKFC